jgi:4-hydroxy-tetrahydrodipicolinate synthase
MIAAGADGLISVAGNEIPSLMKQIVAAALKGDLETARVVHNRVLPLMSGNFIESTPIPVKAVMKMLGILENDTVRSPLAPITEGNRKVLEEILVQCRLAPITAGK